MADRQTKLLLGVIAGALCVIALRPLLPARDASAQTAAPAQQQAPKPLLAKYEILSKDTGGDAGVFLLTKDIDQMAAKGWRVKDVAITEQATVVVMEKLE